MITLFACGPHPDQFGIYECWNCGGATIADGGPFLDPETGANTWCSEECWEEAEEHKARMASRPHRHRACRDPQCGYDNFEHSLYCSIWTRRTSG